MQMVILESNYFKTDFHMLRYHLISVDIELEPREFHFDLNKLSDLYGDLMDCGHFEDTGREDTSGYCLYPVLKLKEHITIVEG
jgi:hypothetical protein